jgi:hypothetical protein
MLIDNVGCLVACKYCKKPIAAMPAKDALCCECRYGIAGSRCYSNHRAELDVVEWLNVPLGYRLVSGSIWISTQNN